MRLLDTNHCSRILDRDPAVIARLEDLREEYFATCAIVEGELFYMAYNSDRREQNLAEVEAFLADIDVLPVDRPAARIYGALKTGIRRIYGPREKRKKATMEKLGFQENDLWIASIAISRGLTVVSADGDFARMQSIIPFAFES